jgi:hypothetical protein
MSEPTVEQTPVVTPPQTTNGHGAPRPGRGAQVRAAFSRTHVVIAALAGLVSVGVSLVFQFAPDLRPDPRDTVGADLSVVAVEPGVSVRDWITRSFQGEERAAQLRRFSEQLDFPGELIYVRVIVDGHKHKEVRLSYALYGATSQRRLPDRLNFAPFSRLRIKAPSERSIQFLFVPDLSFERDLFIRAQLSDSEGVLAVADSGRLRKGLLRPPD